MIEARSRLKGLRRWLAGHAPAPAAAPVVLAHRGYSARAPENTLAAFQKAVDLGVGFELDVTLCATGEVVVLHDDLVDRTTDGHGEVARLTLDELRALDAGAWFDPAFAGERIPTLDEVLERFGGRVLIDIELKPIGHRAQLADAVATLLEQHGVAQAVVVTSFDPLLLEALKRRNAQIPRGQITATFEGSDTVRGLKRAALRYMWLNGRSAPSVIAVEQGRATLRFVRRQHRKGRKVWAWTVNDPARMRELARAGVDALLSDDPALALETLAAKA